MNLINLENKHFNQMCFIIGAGPSLHFQNISEIDKFVTITVNSGILKMPNSDYFLSDDIAVKDWNYFQTTVKDSKCIKLLYKNKLQNEVDHLNSDEIIWYEHHTSHTPDFNINSSDGYTMSNKGSEPIIGARTSAGSAVNLAHIMGCSPIVLLGCDSCYKNGKRYFWQFPGEKQAFKVTNRGPVYSRPDQGQINGKAVDKHCCEFNLYWNKLAKCNKDKVEIIYASEGGLIDAFPRMTLKEVLVKYGDRIKTSI